MKHKEMTRLYSLINLSKIKVCWFCALTAIVPISVCSAQCINTSQYPADNVVASSLTDTVVVSTSQWAGDFYNLAQLSLGKTYRFISSNPADYFSIRDAYDPTLLLAHGPTPLNFTVVSTGQDLVSVHINLQTPPCGTENVNRTTKVVCNNCTPYPATTGINTPEAKSILDVGGEIKVDSIQNPPKAGMIHWNPTLKDFQGYDGIKWKSLTGTQAEWGIGSQAVSQENQSMQIAVQTFPIQLGGAVAISGNFAAVGARNEKINNNNGQGAVYFYYFNGTEWVEHSKVWDQYGFANHEFGSAVAMDGDFAVIGCPNKFINPNSKQGAAFIYQRVGDTWVEKIMLVAPDGAVNDGFGNAVQIRGDLLIVGCMNDDIDDKIDQGSAYIFKRIGSTWILQTKLQSPQGSASDLFGSSVAIHDSLAVVGSPFDDVNLPDQGTAHVYFRMGNTWLLDTFFYPTLANGQFGRSVAVHENWIMVGSPLEDKDGLIDAGTVYWYRRESSTWLQRLKSYKLEPKALERYGIFVVMTNENAAVGAHQEQITSFSSQSVTVFKRESGYYLAHKELIKSDHNNEGSFGSAIALSPAFVLCGDPFQDIGRGKIYFYHIHE